LPSTAARPRPPGLVLRVIEIEDRAGVSAVHVIAGLNRWPASGPLAVGVGEASDLRIDLNPSMLPWMSPIAMMRAD
jgi:hypothetical protein